MSKMPMALIGGAGPGLGIALMEELNAQGYHAIGLTRSGTSKANLDMRACDLSDGTATQALISELISVHGSPKLVVHNVAHLVISALMETSTEEFEKCWRHMVLSAFNLAQNTMRPMVEAGGGTFIVSGATASVRGGSRFHAFASAKFALRGLTQALAREFQTQGVHVVHTLLDGIIDSEASRSLHNLDPAKMMKPEEIARLYRMLAEQPPSIWTHEIDVRPHNENF